MNLINEETLAILINFVIWSLTIATPFMVIMGLMFLFRFYQKWNKKEEKKTEKIIVRQSQQIVEQTEALKILASIAQYLAAEGLLKLPEPEANSDQENPDNTSKPEEDAPPKKEAEINPLEKLNIKELHKLANERGIRGYSRMKKSKLVEKLSR